MKKYNFNPGPSVLPQEVFEKASKAIKEYENTGLSILEMSHRSKEVVGIFDEAKTLVQKLLHVPENFEILFLSGGASSQFFMAPMNLVSEDESIAYLDTGSWSAKAIKAASKVCNVEVLASSKDKIYSSIPKMYPENTAAKYLHYTSNNTIYGTQFQALPKTNLPLISDMSSDIFSRAIDWSKHALVYAGAQKNLGPAGVTLVVVNRNLIGKTNRNLFDMLNYETHIKNSSMYNTPPVFAVFVGLLTLQWIEKNGGIKGIQKRNQEKAQLLYGEIDDNPLFEGTANQEDRSEMNVCFVMKDQEREPEFIDFALQHGCINLKGHRSIGGFRASIYNAMEMEGVKKLVEVMKKFK